VAALAVPFALALFRRFRGLAPGAALCAASRLRFGIVLLVMISLLVLLLLLFKKRS
jgi:hypothetical protein